MRGSHMKKSMTQISLLALAVGSLVGCGSDPKDYDECILKFVKAGMNERAVYALQKSCRAKFPERDESDHSRPLSDQELKFLDGRAGLSHSNYFSGNMYNGNTKLKVNEIEISISSVSGGKPAYRNYREKVSIDPLTTATFGISIVLGDSGSTYNWSLISARGGPAK